MNRVMIAPMTVVGVATLLILQPLLFPNSGWILLPLVPRTVSTLIAAMTPSEPVVKLFVDHLAWPTVLLGGLILILRWVLARAKQTMRQVTPEIDPRI